MSEDQTTIYRADDPAGGARPLTIGESKIFNTSVRGWIALGATLGLVFCQIVVVTAPFWGTQISPQVESSINTLFAGMIGAVVHKYFEAGSKEGQTPK